MKIEQRCILCRNSDKRGLLPLGRGDYVECPDCGGTGVFLMHEQRVAGAPKRVFVSGYNGR